MFDNPKTSLLDLSGAIFEAQPTPLIAYSRSDGVVLLANRAARRLFAVPYSLVGRSVTRLPLVSAVSGIELKHFLLGKPTDPRHPSERRYQDFRQADYSREFVHDVTVSNNDEDDVSSSIRQVEVRITREPPLPRATSRMSIASLSSFDEDIHMLTFERSEQGDPNNPGLSRLPLSSTDDSSISLNGLRAHQNKSASRTRSSASVEDEAHLQSRFAELRDAIYFNEASAGWLLSADETFCFPNYRGAKDAAPVQIDDVELFFESWDVWDGNFNAKLPLMEYPAIWLNRHRTAWKNRRYGLQESGKRFVLESSGDPLYNSDGEYLGGVCWLKNLREYDDVVAKDLEDTLADFKTICNLLPHILWTVDPEGKADYFSKRWYEFTGFTESQSLGHEFHNAIHPHDRQQILSGFHRAAETGGEVRCEARYKHRDWKWVWMAVKAKPALGNDGQPLKWYGSSTDIHDLVMELLEADRTKSQAIGVLAHAEVALFHISPTWQLSKMEGTT